MSMTTSPGSGSRRRIDNGASGDVALTAAQAFAVPGTVDTGKDSTLADIVVYSSLGVRPPGSKQIPPLLYETPNPAFPQYRNLQNICLNLQSVRLVCLEREEM